MRTVATNEEAEAGAAKTAITEKKKKKLLDASTWQRDGRLVETAIKLQRELGEGLFEDHNVFRERVNEAVERLGLKVSGAEMKLLLRAVSWRVETAVPDRSFVVVDPQARRGMLSRRLASLAGTNVVCPAASRALPTHAAAVCSASWSGLYQQVTGTTTAAWSPRWIASYEPVSGPGVSGWGGHPVAS